MKALWSALSIDYADKHNQFPPVYMQTLLQFAPSQVRCPALGIMDEARKRARGRVSETGQGLFHHAGEAIEVPAVEAIDRYMDQVADKMRGFKLAYLKPGERLSIEEKIQGIYEIVKSSVYEEEAIVEKWQPSPAEAAEP